MKIAVVRGPSLNLWEMQNYLPLAEKHELLVIGSPGGKCELDGKIKVRSLLCLGQVFSFIPGGIKFLYRHLGDPQVLWGLEKEVAGFDIVHTAESANYYSFQALRARRRGLFGKLVVTCWENIAGIHREWPAQKRIKRAVIEGADHFLAVTELVKKALIADGAAPEKITVIPMGVDLNKFRIPSFAKATAGKQNSKFTILFVGRLVEEKGVWELLEAFGWLAKEIPNLNLKLRMVGDGPLRGEIRRRAENMGIERKLTIEEKNYSEMPNVYRESDLFVLPSKPHTAMVRGKPTKNWQEQFGMVLVEAMACGLPVVATKSGGIPEVVGEDLPAGRQAGILVNPSNWLELAQGLRKLINDSKLQSDLAKKARQRAEKYFDRLLVAQEIEKVYRKVLKE